MLGESLSPFFFFFLQLFLLNSSHLLTIVFHLHTDTQYTRLSIYIDSVSTEFLRPVKTVDGISFFFCRKDRFPMNRPLRILATTRRRERLRRLLRRVGPREQLLPSSR